MRRQDVDAWMIKAGQSEYFDPLAMKMERRVVRTRRSIVFKKQIVGALVFEQHFTDPSCPVFMIVAMRNYFLREWVNGERWPMAPTVVREATYRWDGDLSREEGEEALGLIMGLRDIEQLTEEEYVAEANRLRSLIKGLLDRLEAGDDESQ